MTWVLWIVGGIAVVVLLISVSSARLIVKPPRQKLWTNPGAEGVAYEDVDFPARDGVRLSGWFIPAEGAQQSPAPTIVMVHGWPWCRLGTQSKFLKDIPGSKPVNLLPLMIALHRAGYNVITFDLRNMGQSQSSGTLTSGLKEAFDALGALDYVNTRPEVDRDRVGVIGLSMGGNTVIYALPYTDQFKGAIAVQPNTSTHFGKRYGHAKMGPLYYLTGPMTEWIYRLCGGVPTKYIDPVIEATGAGQTPVLYVQGKGDKWGSVSNVQQMVDNTPNAVDPIYPETEERYGGYHYIANNPEITIEFFDRYVKGG